MRALCFVLMVVSSFALADIPPPEPASPPDLSCVGKAAGASCNDGGTCRSMKVRRPKLEPGAATPTWGWAEVMVCEKPVPASQARWVVVFVLLLLAAVLSERSRGQGVAFLRRGSGLFRLSRPQG